MNKDFIANASKFLIVGVLSTAVNYGVFFGLFKFLHVNYLVASITGYIVGLIVGFFLNNFWTFNHGKYNFNTIVGYIVVYMLSLGLSTVFLWVTVSHFHYNATIMNLLAICISTVSNFVGLKFIIYKNHEQKYAS